VLLFWANGGRAGTAQRLTAGEDVQFSGRNGYVTDCSALRNARDVKIVGTAKEPNYRLYLQTVL